MRLRQLFGAATVLGAIALMSVAAHAATTYSVGTESGTAGADVSVPVYVSSDTADTDTINGYIIKLTYNPNELTPVAATADATGSTNYAAVGDNYEEGIIVSDITETSDTENTLTIAWASASAVTVSTAQDTLSTVTFNVDDSVTSEATIDAQVVSVASSSSDLSTATIDVSEGGVTVFKYGDINQDTAIDSYDASLALQHYSAALLTTEQIEIGDVNDDGVVDSYDASLILQRYSDSTVVFPVEQSSEE